MIIREYRPADRDAVREISYKTSLDGRAPDFMDAREVIEDALTIYFTDHAPGSCFVAEDNEKVVGYLLGAADAGAVDKVMAWKILPRIFWKGVAQGVISRKKNLLFFWNYFLGLCRGEFRRGTSGLREEFPATFHLNIMEGFRGRGIGAGLVQRNLSFLRSQGSRGVHIGTTSEQAKDFFLKLEFRVLSHSRRQYLKYILGHDTPYYILGKKLKNGY